MWMTDRSPLPQNYIQSAGKLLDDFDHGIGSYSTYGNGTLEVNEDPTYVLVGTKSLKMVSTSTNYLDAIVNTGITDWTGGCLYLWVYVADPTTISQLVIMPRTGTSDYYTFTRAYLESSYHFQPGWNCIPFYPTDLTPSGTPSLENITSLRIRLKSKAESSTTMYIDSIYAGRKTLPSIVFRFDDNYGGEYSTAWPIMNAYGFKPSFCVITNYVIDHESYPTSISLEQYQEMYDAGAAIMPHTTDHTQLGTLGSIQENIDKIQPAMEYLSDNGMPRAVHHFGYPVGSFSEEYTIPACQQLGILTAQAGTGYLHYPFWNSLYKTTANFLKLYSLPINNSVSLDTAKSYVDTCRSKGQSCIIILHNIVDTPSISTDWSTANFQALIDYIAASRVPIKTIDEWYAGITNPRYRSVPLTRTLI